jgi:hypothetical protein
MVIVIAVAIAACLSGMILHDPGTHGRVQVVERGVTLDQTC